MLDRLHALEERYESLTAEMGRPDVVADYQRLQALAKERASIEEVVSLFRARQRVQAEIEDAKALLQDAPAPGPPRQPRRDRRDQGRYRWRRGRPLRRRPLPHVQPLRRHKTLARGGPF